MAFATAEVAAGEDKHDNANDQHQGDDEEDQRREQQELAGLGQAVSHGMLGPPFSPGFFPLPHLGQVVGPRPQLAMTFNIRIGTEMSIFHFTDIAIALPRGEIKNQNQNE